MTLFGSSGKPTSKMSMGIETVDSDLKEELKATAQVSEGSWTTTTPSGLRVATIGDRTVDASPILAYRATDPISETVSTISTSKYGACGSREQYISYAAVLLKLQVNTFVCNSFCA